MCNRKYVQIHHQSNGNVEVSFEGMNSITIHSVLQIPNDRVQNIMDVDSQKHMENNNSQEELTSLLRRWRQLERTQNRRDQGIVNSWD